ncbi:hypothetical protein SAMN05421505_10569 [Sinosporangium album]|uniref:Glycosyl transferase family 2 n=1 Tax=Sinosporangium album TaxID=504805 RepID=A0A1G7V1A6_9ACTN|nr:hypothetical protein [Sinosporangium album]SDG53504.1 hypothetical protein SAMN05421505_10569 [Sinosporangium album]
MAGGELDSTRRALREALAQAERAADLARALDATQARLADAERLAEELRTTTEQLNAAEEKLAAERTQTARLRRDLAEQRYQTEVANWKLSSIKVARWSRLGDAIKTGKRNPVRLAKGLKGAARPAKRPAAPKRQAVPDPAAAAKAPAPGAAFQATTSTRVVAGTSFKLKPYRVPTGPNTRPHLTVAVVAEPHAEALLRYEWRQTTGFTPRDFHRVLPAEIPHMVLVESVSEGPWAEEIAGEPGEGLRALLAWCAERGIRTVFWHTKGDVADYARAAKLFEHVVTADATSLPRWREAVGRAEHFGFAVQPRIHNPIPLAGGRFDRVLTLDELLPGHLAYPDVLTSYRWPRAVDCPPGTAPWRLAEIAACGTPIGTVTEDRRTHQTLRKTYAAGTMTERVDTLLGHVGLPAARATLTTSIILAVQNPAELDAALAQISRQTGDVRQLVLMGPPEAARHPGLPQGYDVVVRAADPTTTTGGLLNRALDLCDGDLVAVMDPRDLYGPHYLTDLSRAFLYSSADIVGKASHYAHLSAAGATLLRRPDAEYSYLPEIAGGTLLARRNVLRGLGFPDLTDGWDEVLMRQCRTDGVKVFSTDRFEYVCVREEDTALLSSAHLIEYGPAEPHALF